MGRLKSDSAIVAHPLLFCRRTHVRSILSALQFRCSGLILLDNSLPPPLLDRLLFPFLRPSSAPLLPTQQTDSRALSYNVVTPGGRRKNEMAEMRRRREAEIHRPGAREHILGWECGWKSVHGGGVLNIYIVLMTSSSHMQ